MQVGSRWVDEYSETREYFERLEKMKREAQEVQKARGKFTPPSDPLISKRPALAAYLADAFWDDGTPREVCTLKVRWDADNVTVSLQDGEKERSMTTTSSSLDDALELMEAHIVAKGPSWRSWGNFKKKK